jgi:hypothetical protein
VVEVLAAGPGGSCPAAVERRAVVVVDGRASAASFNRLPRGRCCRAVVRRLERHLPGGTGPATGAAPVAQSSSSGSALSLAEKAAVAKLGPYAASQARAAAAASAVAAALQPAAPINSGGVEGASGGLGVGGSASASAAAATLGAWVTVQASAPVAFVSPAAARLEWLPPAGLYAPGPVAVTLLWEDCPGVRGWTVGGGLVA